jgi:hypothetical protein
LLKCSSLEDDPQASMSLSEFLGRAWWVAADKATSCAGLSGDFDGVVQVATELRGPALRPLCGAQNDGNIPCPSGLLRLVEQLIG